MTWFWFILFGIIGLAKRDVFKSWVSTWADESLKNTSVVGLVLFAVGGTALLPFNEGRMWLLHLAAGIGGVLGFFAVAESTMRGRVKQGERVRTRREALNQRLRETMRADESTVEESDRARAMSEQATGQPPVVEVSPGPEDPGDRLLSILKQMAEDNEQGRQEEVLTAREEHQAGVESMREERAIRARGMKVNLGTTGIYGRPQGSEWQGFEPENAADYGIADEPDAEPEAQHEMPGTPMEELQAEPVEAPAVSGTLEPVAEPEDAGEPEVESAPEPEPEPEVAPEPELEPEPVAAAVDKRPPSAGPAREGYTPGPARLGGAPGAVSSGPVTLGPAKPVKSGPVTLSPGFSYQPQLVDSKLDKPVKPVSRF